MAKEKHRQTVQYAQKMAVFLIFYRISFTDNRNILYVVCAQKHNILCVFKVWYNLGTNHRICAMIESRSVL